jgi:pimeloyl-ACP methyl ester carboxylesterase
MLHGAMESAQSHMRLAQALADAFTVYLPDRRGHMLGVPFAENYSMRKEVEDLDALLTKTGSHNIFGVSAGGLICLQAALTLPAVHKAAIYEPVLLLSDPPLALSKRLDEEIVQGKIAAALITGMKGSQMGPPLFNAMPRWLLERITNTAIAQEEKQAKQGDVTMRMLAPTLHYDFELASEMAQTLASFKAVHTEVLLLGGSKSQAYLKYALDALEQVLPHVRRLEFPGVDHGGSSDPSPTNKHGNPELVAQELRRFFA